MKARAPASRLTLGPLDARRAGAADRDAIASCVRAAADYFRRAEGSLPPEAIAADKLAEAELDPSRRVYLLSLDRTPVGLLDLALHAPAPQDVTIALLVLAQDRRRRGLGRSAAEALFEELRGCGFARVQLGVAPGERAAAAFWASLGMSDAGRDGAVRLFELELAT